MKKKQILFLIGVIVVVIVGVAILFLGDDDATPSNTYHESERQDTIPYNGKEYRYNEHLSNFLFVGVDTREEIETDKLVGEAGHADTIFLVSLDRVKGAVRVFSIPRDTMTNIRVLSADGDDMGQTVDHITMQYTFGDGKWKSCELMKEAVSQLFYGVTIQGYCAMNMDGISVATDILGGVQLMMEDDLFAEIDPSYAKGTVVTITGENAERIVRYRNKEQTNSALDRMHRQMILLESFAKKAKSKASADEQFITKMLDGVQDYMITNIGNDMYAKMLESSFNGDDVCVIPGEGKAGEMFDEYHVNDTEMYELVIDAFYVEVK